MAAHNDLRGSTDTQISYRQVAKFKADASRKKLEDELEMSQELAQVRSSVGQVTTILETLLDDAQNM